MNILVTGGAGFIGSHIVDRYVEAGHQVTIVDDLSIGMRENVNPNVEFQRIDIRDYEGLYRLFSAKKFEIICHQAARASVRESFEKPILYAEINVIGSLNLLELCRIFGIRKFIYASSGGAVYGEPRYLPVDEKHPVNPLDPYGASKHHVEHYLHLYRTNFKISYTILRYANVYGPRQDPHGEAGVVAIFAGRMLLGDQSVINGSGEQERDFVYVGDIADANLLALWKGDDAILNLGTGCGTSINTLHDKLREITGYINPAVHERAKAGEVFKIWLDIYKARSELGWSPSVGLDQGLEKTVRYLQGTLRKV